MITKELSTRSMRWKNNARRPGCDQHLAGIARSIQQVDATPSRLDSSTILNNRIYLGEIPHKENSYTGEHAAIIDQELWQKVHAKLAENVHARRHGTNASAPSALRGLLYDEDGNRFTASHAIKNGKRYRYYVSQRVARNGPRSADEPNRIPAREIEDLIVARLKNFFVSPDQVVSLLACAGDDVATMHDLVQAAAHFAQELNVHSAAHLNEMLTTIMLRATVLRESVGIQCHKHAIRARLLAASDAGEADLDADNEHVFTLEIPARLKRCSGEMRLIIPGPAANNQRQQPASSLVKAVSRAHEWIRRIESGKFKDQRAIAVASGLGERYVSRILPSAFLAPEIVEAILEGRHASDLTLDTLLKDVPPSWAEQRRRQLNSPHQ